MPAPLSRRAAFGAAAAVLPVAGVASCQPVPAASAPCPAAEIGRELAALVDEHHAADCALVAAAPGDRAAAERCFDALNAAVSGRTRALAEVRATSLPGAMAQAMCAVSLFSPGVLDDGWRTAAFMRLMASVVNALEAAGGVRREAMAGEYLMARGLDATRGHIGGDAPASPDAALEAMADEAFRLWAAYAAKGEFRDDLADDMTAEEAKRAEDAFYAEADAALEVADHMSKERACTLAGLEAKARVCGMFDRAHEGYAEHVLKLGRSIAADVERGVLPGGCAA